MNRKLRQFVNKLKTIEPGKMAWAVDIDPERKINESVRYIVIPVYVKKVIAEKRFDDARMHTNIVCGCDFYSCDFVFANKQSAQRKARYLTKLNKKKIL